jgi:transposase InsO family protein/transposase-like protein
MARSKKAKKGPRSRRFTDEQRELALTLVQGGMTLASVAKKIGTTEASVCNWRKAAMKNGTMPVVPIKRAKSADGRSTARETVTHEVEGKPGRAILAKLSTKSPYAPADPAQGLSNQEVAAILECKTKHLSMGPAQIRSQLKRFKGWRISIKAIKRVLKQHGYESVYRGSRPQGEVIQRFEAPRRNALWQADFAEVRVGPEKLYALIMLDDFSRYVVGWALCSSPSSSIVVETFRSAIARHGKPESVRTDRGSAFVAFAREGDFGRVLEAEDVTHIVGKSYRPKGGGKVESAVRTLRRELWDLEHFEDRDHAEERLKEFFAEYNERRAHMGIDGLTPADRFFGRADVVLAHINALSRHRQGVLAQSSPSGSAIEELVPMRSGNPMEVLRLMLVDGTLELRFCGARVVLGQVEC